MKNPAYWRWRKACLKSPFEKAIYLLQKANISLARILRIATTLLPDEEKDSKCGPSARFMCLQQPSVECACDICSEIARIAGSDLDIKRQRLLTNARLSFVLPAGF